MYHKAHVISKEELIDFIGTTVAASATSEKDGRKTLTINADCIKNKLWYDVKYGDRKPEKFDNIEEAIDRYNDDCKEVPESRKRKERVGKQIEEFLKSEIGPTGKHPEGKISKDDDGELRVGLSILDGNVVMKFGKSVAWIGLPPENARQFGLGLLKCAGNIDGKIMKVEIGEK